MIQSGINYKYYTSLIKPGMMLSDAEDLFETNGTDISNILTHLSITVRK